MIWHKACLVAYFKGYRVTDDGRLLSPGNKQLHIRARASDRGYPRFGVWLEDEKRSVRIPAHKFAALCFFGPRSFSSHIRIRHMNDRRDDFSRANLALGTQSDNERDKCPDLRSRVARKAGKASAAARKKRNEQQGSEA